MIKKIVAGSALSMLVLFGNFSIASVAALTDVEVTQSKTDQEDPKSKKKKKKSKKGESCCAKSSEKSCSKKGSEEKKK